MAIDPNTGQDYSANTVGGQMGIDALSNAGVDTPLIFDLLASSPTAAHTTAWNMRRVSRTMTHGGRKGLRGQFGLNDISTVQGSALSRLTRGRSAVNEFSGGRGIRQTFSPLGGRRLANASNIEPLTDKGYTPFNFVANYANKGAGRLAKMATREDAGGLAKTVAGRLNMFGAASEGETYFSPGTLGRLSSMSRVYRGSDKALGKMAPHLYESLSATNPEAYKSMYGKLLMRENGFGAAAGRATSVLGDSISFANPSNELGQMVGLSMRGRFSQGISGYVHASQMASKGIDAKAASYLAEEGSGFARGAAKFAEHIDAGGIAAKFAGAAKFAPAALEGASIVGNILLARDLAIMGGKVISRAASTMVEAGNSVKGSIDKPIMGMGYKDNTVAATSRQRGVMAISNSRLNMRSVLGSEAASIHAAWG